MAAEKDAFRDERLIVYNGSMPATQLEMSGLSSDEARRRLQQSGPNSMPSTSAHLIRSALGKFWAPVPWMLEAVIVVELGLHDGVEALVIAVLLIFNAALSFFQESHAQATLAALKSRLALTASVHRDGLWKAVPAADLVAGDIVKLSLGAVVAADVRLLDGSVMIDLSMLPGESVPIEAGPGLATYAGALVRRGEAVAEVTATGTRTKFGRTAELVHTGRFGQMSALVGNKYVGVPLESATGALKVVDKEWFDLMEVLF